MSFSAQTSTHTVVTTQNETVSDAPSIRQIILTSLVHGCSKDETMALVIEHHRNSAAAAKFGRHYAWYKGWLKKNPAEARKFV